MNNLKDPSNAYAFERIAAKFHDAFNDFRNLNPGNEVTITDDEGNSYAIRCVEGTLVKESMGEAVARIQTTVHLTKLNSDVNPLQENF